MFTRTYRASEIRRALDCYTRIQSFRKVSRIMGISKSTVHRWWNSFHGLGIRPKLQKKKKVRTKQKYQHLTTHLSTIFQTSKMQYFSLQSVQFALKQRYQICPSISWIHNVLKKARVSRRRLQIVKLVSSNNQRFQTQEDIFANALEKYSDDEIVCIDETGFSNLGNAVYGYYPKGSNPIEHSVTKRERRSLIMAIHHISGVVSYCIQKTPFNTETFASFLKNVLIPNLPHGVKAIIMDNVAFHKTNVVKKILADHGIQSLFIPPYSPRCNPIEEVFSLLKRNFRIGNVEASLDDRISDSIQMLKLYKDYQHNYNHTREYVASCPKSVS